MTHPGENLWRTLMRAAVRTFPRAWRARYEAEMLALIEDLPIGPRQFVDVLRAGGREWMREMRGSLLGPWPMRAAGSGARLLEDASGIALQSAAILTLIQFVVPGLFPWLADADVSWLGSGWTAANAVHLAFLTIRAIVLTSVAMRLITVVMGFFGRRPVDGWWLGVRRLLVMFLALGTDALLSHQLHLWPSMRDLRPELGEFPIFIWVLAWNQAHDQLKGRDVWRWMGRIVTFPYRLYRQGRSA